MTKVKSAGIYGFSFRGMEIANKQTNTAAVPIVVVLLLLLLSSSQQHEIFDNNKMENIYETRTQIGTDFDLKKILFEYNLNEMEKKRYGLYFMFYAFLCFQRSVVFFHFDISVFIQRSFLRLSIFSYKKSKKMKKTATPQTNTQYAMPAMPCTKTSETPTKLAGWGCGCDGYTEWKNRDDCFYISSKILQFTRKPKPEFNIRFKIK